MNCKQGDNGEYPSINEYADAVFGRMGNVADSARIDDTEENYFDERIFSDSLNPVRGFYVSHLDNCKDDKSKGFMPIDLELKKDTNGYYTIVSAMPHKAKIKGTLIYDGSSRPSTATTDSLLSSDINGKGGDDVEIVLAKSNVPLSTKRVAQPAENVKKLNLPKGITAEVSIAGDNSDIIQVKFNGEQGKGKKGSCFQDLVKRRKNAMSLLICRVMSCWRSPANKKVRSGVSGQNEKYKLLVVFENILVCFNQKFYSSKGTIKTAPKPITAGIMSIMVITIIFINSAIICRYCAIWIDSDEFF